MSFNIIDDVVVIYDDKAQRDLIKPDEWNANFKAVEDTVNANTAKTNANFDILVSTEGAVNVGAVAVKEGGSETVQGVLGELQTDKVSLAGDETVAGVKTFSSSPIIPTPTTDYQAATKKYIDLVAASLTLGGVSDSSITNNKLGNDVKVGSLAGLSTTQKSSVVAALNELHAAIGDLVVPVLPTIVNDLTAIVTGSVLDATQGKVLKDMVGVKADKATNTILRTDSFTLSASDEAKLQKCFSAAQIDVTIPSDGTAIIALETEIPFVRYGAGAVVFVKDTGVTVRSVDGKLTIDKQYQTVHLKKIASNEWLLFGALA